MRNFRRNRSERKNKNKNKMKEWLRARHFRVIFVFFVGWNIGRSHAISNDYVRTTPTATDANEVLLTYVCRIWTGFSIHELHRTERCRTKNNLYRFWATHVIFSDKPINSFFFINVKSSFRRKFCPRALSATVYSRNKRIQNSIKARVLVWVNRERTLTHE